MVKLLTTVFLFTAALATAQSPEHSYNGIYKGVNNNRVAFPIGGMGAGMFCLSGTGAITSMSVRNNPDVFNEPLMFAAISVKGMPNSAKVLEGPVPAWKKFGQKGSALGAEGTTFGLARFRGATFQARFPFGEVILSDNTMPVAVTITGWSPFIPTDADNSGLPAGALEYRFKNTSSKTQGYIFSYNAANFMALQSRNARIDTSLGANHIKATKNGFILSQDATAASPKQQGDFAIFTDDDKTIVDHCWFRGDWWDPITMAWNNVENNRTVAVAPVEKDAPGASLYIPFTLKPGEERTIHVMMCWYVPNTTLRTGAPIIKPTDSAVTDLSVNLPSRYYKPWYSNRFTTINNVVSYWQDHYNELRKKTVLFRDAFYKSTLPAEVTEAVVANIAILKTPTVLRQYDGRFWAWEGSNDNVGSCPGTCTHVWNYAQALPHLFPAMERSIRETEYNENMDAIGHQNYRGAIPIRPSGHQYYLPAADGQLGSIMRVYREWRISGDNNWLKTIYPKVKISIDYCIKTWDPRHTGTLEEPHHNTYDIEFWGPDGMCTSLYLGALQAFTKMGASLQEDISVYRDLYTKGKSFLEQQLYNGEYFSQKITWKGLDANPMTFGEGAGESGAEYSSEAKLILEKEGPKYQYGNGCLSDGVIGAWQAKACGLPDIIDEGKVKSHLMAVYKYNYKTDLTDFSNPQRPSFAIGKEGGLLLCSWPKGGKLSLPFVYSNEVWTGIEYQVASHLMFEGKVKEGLDIVRACRNRYNGIVRNPFDEYECGHWYSRAMSSYALIEALTGVRYDAIDKTLYVDSKIGDFTSFLSTNTGFGNVIYKNGKASVQVAYGTIDIQHIVINKKA